ncbi:hypothetical protein JHK87_052737 [Glycine soja]|nr:hypothetical protein JHK87_052737 [Glycine soja]
MKAWIPWGEVTSTLVEEELRSLWDYMHIHDEGVENLGYMLTAKSVHEKEAFCLMQDDPAQLDRFFEEIQRPDRFYKPGQVQTLLEKENPHYTIHTTIFPGSDASHLFNLLPFTATYLTLFPVDLLDAAALSHAIFAYSNVFHVASP